MHRLPSKRINPTTQSRQGKKHMRSNCLIVHKIIHAPTLASILAIATHLVEF